VHWKSWVKGCRPLLLGMVDWKVFAYMTILRLLRPRKDASFGAAERAVAMMTQFTEIKDVFRWRRGSRCTGEVKVF
jgi:hypothetical protein